MCKSHALDVNRQWLGEFAVAPRFRSGFFLPRTDMDFVNAHRRTQRIALATFLHPGIVRPLEFFCVPNNGGLLGRDFEEKSERIGIQLDVAVNIADLKFVMRAFTNTGNKNFPNTGRPKQSHGMKPSIPLIEIADDTDALRVGRPDSEAGPVNTINQIGRAS